MTYCVLMVLDILGNLIFASRFPLRLVVMSLAYVLGYTISIFCIFDLRYGNFELFYKCIQFSPKCIYEGVFFCLVQLFYLENMALSVSKAECRSNNIAVISFFDLQFQSTCLYCKDFYSDVASGNLRKKMNHKHR